MAAAAGAPKGEAAPKRDAEGVAAAGAPKGDAAVFGAKGLAAGAAGAANGLAADAGAPNYTGCRMQDAGCRMQESTVSHSKSRTPPNALGTPYSNARILLLLLNHAPHPLASDSILHSWPMGKRNAICGRTGEAGAPNGLAAAGAPNGVAGVAAPNAGFGAPNGLVAAGVAKLPKGLAAAGAPKGEEAPIPGKVSE